MAGKYDKVSLRYMNDESLILMLIEIGRAQYDPQVPKDKRPTMSEASSVVAELLDRLDTHNKLMENNHLLEVFGDNVQEVITMVDRLNGRLSDLSTKALTLPMVAGVTALTALPSLPYPPTP